MGNLLKRVISCAMVCLIGVGGAGITGIEMPITTITASADETYKTWKQGDSRWGSMRLGGSGYTMSNSGCAATALSMLMVHSGSINDSSFTPATLCTFFNNNGGFSSRGDISWSVANKMSSSFSFQGYGTLTSSSSSGKTEEIKNYLDAGYYLIVGVKNGGHWVAVDRVENGIVYIIDPANGQVRNLFEAYSNSGIYKLRKFKGANSVSNSNVVIEDTQENQVEELTALSTEKKSTTTTNTNSNNSTTSNASGNGTGVYKLGYELCLRTDATSSADVIDIIPCASILNVSETNGNWGYVCYNGNMGWINLDYTSKVQSSFDYEKGTYTTAEPLNYRASATTSAESYGIIPINTEIDVIEVNNNWGKVSYNGKSAWICLNYASYGVTDFSSAVNVAKSNTSSKIGVYTTNDNLCLREANTTDSTKLDVIPNGTKIDIIEINGNWGKTIYNARVGWVYLDYTDFNSSFNTIPCDINYDNELNVQDILYVSEKLRDGSSFTQNEINMLDFNEDGVIDVSDYTLLKKIILL